MLDLNAPSLKLSRCCCRPEARNPSATASMTPPSSFRLRRRIRVFWRHGGIADSRDHQSVLTKRRIRRAARDASRMWDFRPWPMKIATINIKDFNKRLANLRAWLHRAGPGVACLQELKAINGAFPIAAIEKAGYGAPPSKHAAVSRVVLGIKNRPMLALYPRVGFPVDSTSADRVTNDL